MKRILSLCIGSILVFGIALAQDAQDRPIRVGGNVAAANLVSQAPPAYPAEAKQNRVQGVVVLAVTIDKQGRISELSVVSGPSELIQSATDAVWQWIYKPTLLNGQPVNVQTTVNVNYTLSQ